MNVHNDMMKGGAIFILPKQTKKTYSTAKDNPTRAGENKHVPSPLRTSANRENDCFCAVPTKLSAKAPHCAPYRSQLHAFKTETKRETNHIRTIKKMSNGSKLYQKNRTMTETEKKRIRTNQNPTGTKPKPNQNRTKPNQNRTTPN